jgi:NADP-dependent 3-hydroxy acid dehydrogenase YdfG
VLGSRGEQALASTAYAITANGGQVAFQRIDVTRPEDLSALVDLAVQRFGRLDVLASVAGVAINAQLESGELDDWNQMIDVNLRGVLHGIAAALPVFRSQGAGHFITVGSTAAAKWVPGQAVYAATKAAVRALCDVLRQELAPEGLRCTLVTPGFTDTDFISSTRDPGEPAALTARRDAIAMSPEVVAEAIVFAVAQPDLVDIGEIVVRPTVQP